MDATSVKILKSEKAYFAYMYFYFLFRLYVLYSGQPLLITSEMVNKLTCSCGSTYIRQTRRNLLSEIKEHATSEKSKVCKHLLNILPIALFF